MAKVKIKKCSWPESWYNDLIGEEFEIVRSGRDFILLEDYSDPDGPWRHIDPQDCEWCE